MASKEGPSKKVLLLHTGGTLGMELSGQPKDDAAFLEALKKHAPRIFEIADLQVEILLNKDSSNMVIEDWQKIAQKLDEEKNKWDAFVVTHGTDTLAFTTSALCFMLQGFPKPIIFTGSQQPLASPYSDAPRNLIYAVEVAASKKLSGVHLFFDSVLLHGARAKKTSIPSYKAFESPNFPPLARAGVRMDFSLIPFQDHLAYEKDLRLDSKVICLNLFPSFDPTLLPTDSFNFHGVVLSAFGPGDMPTENKKLLQWIRELHQKEIPVVVCSQATHGGVDLTLYETGRLALEAGVLSAGDMTFEATLCKMMSLLGRELSFDEFKKLFAKNLVGELTEGS